MLTSGIAVPLRHRPLDPRADPGLLSTVQIGSTPWEDEVEIFLRTKSCQHEEKGNCSTTLFLEPDREKVVGFIATSSISLEADKDFRQLFEISNRLAPMSPVQASFIVALGVDARYRGNGERKYGTEIYLAFLEELATSMRRPRFIYLDVWDNSPAVRLYERWGFRRLRPKPIAGSEEQLLVPDDQPKRLRMAVDRFQKPPA